MTDEQLAELETRIRTQIDEVNARCVRIERAIQTVAELADLGPADRVEIDEIIDGTR